MGDNWELKQKVDEIHILLERCDAYEARIAELERERDKYRESSARAYVEAEDLRAELARVKAESLRVVADGKPVKNFNVVRHKVVLYKGELWKASNIPYQLINVCDEETIDPPENATVQPVRRLERWEMEE